tara:strand:+ start:335 stop:1651 length:1317 start_codon:yes stop_codon:yes gene_type:complete
MSTPLVAIIGRPNVGKSTFFNRVLSNRHAIVDPQEGITRDRIYGEMEWSGHNIKFIDTGGLIYDDRNDFNSAIRIQANDAIVEADLILLMVDGKQGLMPNDKILAKSLRKNNKPCLIAVNKCDEYKSDNLVNQFYELGIKDILPISSLNGRLTGDLLDQILKKLKIKHKKTSTEKNAEIKLAIVGMPNVGKSSLTNALLKKDRSIVTPIAGTTRDAIDADLKWYGQKINLIDTAGLRKLAKLTDKVEYYSRLRANKAIKNSDVTLILIDAVKGFNRQDKAIMDEVIKNGKGVVLIVNKWDLITKDSSSSKNFHTEITRKFKSLKNYPIIFISALTKQRIHRVLEEACSVYKRAIIKISTNELNEELKKIIIKKPPQSDNGKQIQIKYITQVSTQPTIFALYTNYPKKIKVQYARYLENQFRKKFDLQGVPLILSFRKK